ncbi:MAG: O-antigen ligase family protein [Phycisphaerales bacterium]|nr:MAG: O-antigen ligase family protein [Phycisphaerales bacterium]
MSIVRITNPDQVRPLHVVLIVLVYAVLLGSCLLTCGSGRIAIPDGAVAWRPDSLFRAVVELLNLNNTQPTPNGVAIKSLILAMGSALAMVAVAVAVFVRPRRGEEVSGDDTIVEAAAEPERDEVPAVRSVTKRQVPPLTVALAFAVLYVLWSFASVLWSGRAKDLALAGSALLAMHVLWALALGLGLSRVAARTAGYALLVAGIATAIITLWYRMERNPTLRASHPIGNPIVLAACLIPGLVIAASLAGAEIVDAIGRRRYRRLAVAAACIAALIVMGWAFRAADSRGPMIGLGLALLAVAFLALGRRGKAIIGCGTIVAVVIGAVLLWQVKDSYSPTGRSGSLRVRLHAWQYGLDLAGQRVLLGHGQGGFARKGDELAIDDVLDDPEALAYPIRHAHNEYVEVLADLGVVGVLLFVGALALTFWAAMAALPTLPSRSLRWALIAMTASLFGLAAQEIGGVGLRLPGMPTVFYTVWGLVWAISYTGRSGQLAVLQRTSTRRWLTLGVGLALGLSVGELGRRDFAAARNQYELEASLGTLEWDRALRQADYAGRWRLSPQRRLVALDRQIATRLVVATRFQERALRRLRAAYEQVPPDQTLLALAKDDVDYVGRQVSEGLALATELVEKAPRCWNAGWLQFGLRELEYRFAMAMGDARRAAQYADAAGEALQRELERRPFDPMIAASYVEVVGGKLSLEDIFDVLARPIRYERLIPAYRELIQSIATTGGFGEAFEPLLQRSLQATRVEAFEQWSTPLAPERLRICAIVSVVHQQFDRAEELLSHAVTLYGRLPKRAQVGLASCYAELADSRFFADPDNPQRAIEAAESAVKEAPPSYVGRQIIQAVRRRLVTYHLAAGRESFVRSNLLPEPVGSLRPEAVDAEVAARYTRMCQTLLYRGTDALPVRMQEWIDRALELNPEDSSAWLIEAELAFRDGADERCVKSLTQALDRGADPGIILDFVQAGLEKRPASEPLLIFERLLRQKAGVGGPPPRTQPTTQPATQPTTVPASQADPATTGARAADP